MEKEEYRRMLHESISREGVIPGIYNYCDRWCEHCDFTEKCALAIQEDFMKKKNMEFTEELKMIFEVTKDMLMEEMERLGIQFDPDAELPEEYDPGELCRELKQKSLDYGVDVLKWIKDFNPSVGISPTVKDALDVVSFYSLTIGVKTNRAIPDMDPDEFAESDTNGSAKVALLSIEKSLKAWIILYEALPAHEDEILGWMKELSWLQHNLEKEFPGARAFIRPGFDE